MLLREMMDLSGKLALVTGGTGFLGAHMSHALLEMGARVIVTSRGKSKDFLEDLVSPHEIARSRLMSVKADLSTAEGIDSLMRSLTVPGGSAAGPGKIDILINNHFDWPKVLDFGQQSWDDIEKTVKTGIISPLYLTQAVFQRMVKQGSGSIINVSSMYGKVSPNHAIYRQTPGMGNAIEYGACKAALLQATRYIASIGGPHGIRCNAISPGPFPRPGAFDGVNARDSKEWFREELEDRTMLGSVGRPEQLKGVIALLASDLGSYITGTDIAVDGGWTSW